MAGHTPRTPPPPPLLSPCNRKGSGFWSRYGCLCPAVVSRLITGAGLALLSSTGTAQVRTYVTTIALKNDDATLPQVQDGGPQAHADGVGGGSCSPAASTPLCLFAGVDSPTTTTGIRICHRTGQPKTTRRRNPSSAKPRNWTGDLCRSFLLNHRSGPLRDKQHGPSLE